MPKHNSTQKQRSFNPHPNWPKSVNPTEPQAALFPTPAPLDLPKFNLRTFLKTQSRQLDSSDRQRPEPASDLPPQLREPIVPGS